MTIFIIVVTVLLSLVAIVLISALIAPRGYKMQREIVIDMPVDTVFNYIKYLKNQDYYSKWVMTDPTMNKQFTGKDGTVGFIYAWNGNKEAGEGEQEIVHIIEGERLDIEVRFIRPFKGKAMTPFRTESISENQTKLTWGMSSEMPFPMNAVLLVMNMDKALGKDLETSLNTLKSVLEKS